MRVTIYSRYSSDLQDPRSLADQTAACRRRAAREGWTVTAEFSDAAISGASMINRPGLRDLMTAAERGDFDAVLCDLHRLSRDMEDIAGLHKRLAFKGIEIITLADGSVSKLHMGFRAIIASTFLDDLAQKTRRGQAGRVRAGYIPGGRCYGYDIVAEGAQRGAAPSMASKLRSYVGFSRSMSRDIRRLLSLRGSMVRACPRRAGDFGTLQQSTARAGGKTKFCRTASIWTSDLQSTALPQGTVRAANEQARENPRSEWMTTELPELRIIDAETWEAAQGRRAGASCLHLTHRRRPKQATLGAAQGSGGVWRELHRANAQLRRPARAG